MSSSGCWQTTAPNKAGRWVSITPTSRAPCLPRMVQIEAGGRQKVADVQEIVIRLVFIDRLGRDAAKLRHGDRIALPASVFVRQPVNAAAHVIEFVEEQVMQRMAAAGQRLARLRRVKHFEIP